jgi:hypothetical protein
MLGMASESGPSPTDRELLMGLVDAADQALANLDNSADPHYPGFTDLRRSILDVRKDALLKLAQPPSASSICSGTPPPIRPTPRRRGAHRTHG